MKTIPAWSFVVGAVMLAACGDDGDPCRSRGGDCRCVDARETAADSGDEDASVGDRSGEGGGTDPAWETERGPVGTDVPGGDGEGGVADAAPEDHGGPDSGEVGEQPEIALNVCAWYDPTKPWMCSLPDESSLPLPEVLKVAHWVAFTARAHVRPWTPYCEHPIHSTTFVDGTVIAENYESRGPNQSCDPGCPSECMYSAGNSPPFDPEQMDYGPHEFRIQVRMPGFDASAEAAAGVWLTRCETECATWDAGVLEDLFDGCQNCAGNKARATFGAYLEEDGEVTVVTRLLLNPGSPPLPWTDVFLMATGWIRYPLSTWGRWEPIEPIYPPSSFEKGWKAAPGSPFLYVPKTTVLAGVTAMRPLADASDSDGPIGYRLEVWKGEEPGYMYPQPAIVDIENPTCRGGAIGLVSDHDGGLHFLNGRCLDPDSGEPALLDYQLDRDGSVVRIRSLPVDPGLHATWGGPFVKAVFDDSGILHLFNGSQYVNSWTLPLRDALDPALGGLGFVPYRQRVVIHTFDTRYSMDLGGFNVTTSPSSDLLLQPFGEEVLQAAAQPKFCYIPALPDHLVWPQGTCGATFDVHRDPCGREWAVGALDRYIVLSDNRQGTFHSRLIDVLEEASAVSDGIAVTVDQDEGVLVVYRDPGTGATRGWRSTCSEYTTTKGW